jgi:hypothetical protein
MLGLGMENGNGMVMVMLVRGRLAWGVPTSVPGVGPAWGSEIKGIWGGPDHWMARALAVAGCFLSHGIPTPYIRDAFKLSKGTKSICCCYELMLVLLSAHQVFIF